MGLHPKQRSTYIDEFIRPEVCSKVRNEFFKLSASYTGDLLDEQVELGTIDYCKQFKN